MKSAAAGRKFLIAIAACLLMAGAVAILSTVGCGTASEAVDPPLSEPLSSEDAVPVIIKTGEFVSVPPTSAQATTADFSAYEVLMDPGRPLVSEVSSKASRETSSKTSKAASSQSSKAASSKTTSVELSADELIKLPHEELAEINSDYFGKLTVEGPEIHEIVCVGADYDVYLRKNFYKKYYYYGTVFTEAATSQTSLDRNIIFYGHNTGKSKPNNNKFGKLRYFREEGYAKKHPYVSIDTPFGKFKYQIFTVFLSPHILPASEYKTHFTRTHFSSAEDMKTFAEAMAERSIVDCGEVTFTGNENLITLVTCVYDFDEAKLVIMARQVE